MENIYTTLSDYGNHIYNFIRLWKTYIQLYKIMENISEAIFIERKLNFKIILVS